MAVRNLTSIRLLRSMIVVVEWCEYSQICDSCHLE